MIAIKGMEPQTDCSKCPFMATDGADTLLSPMMCMALWATKHKVKHCAKEKILDDCPLVEIVTCEKAPELTASEKKFLADIVNAYAGLVNIQIVKKFCDVTRDAYYLKFKDDINSSDSSNTFSCFRGMFTELEEGKDYNIRKLLGKDC